MIITQEQNILVSYNTVKTPIDYLDFNRHYANVKDTETLKGNFYVPLVPSKTVLVPVSTNEILIRTEHRKVNHAPVADFTYDLTPETGRLVLQSTSTDPDNDELTLRWTITDDILFRDPNVLYNFKRPGAHSITLDVSDGDLSDSKTVSVVSTNDENSVNDYIIPDFTIAQDGNDFLCTDISETYNVYSYQREWYLDGNKLAETSETLSLTLTDKQRHTITLKAFSSDFERSVSKYAYADVSAIITVRSIVINRGQTVELDGSNSYAIEDLVNSYEWEEIPGNGG